MTQMMYYMPTRIFDEPDALMKHGDALSALGTKALLVTGGHSASLCGAEADARSALKQNGIEAVLFNEVEENPSIETVMKARDFGLTEGADFVIGIGGGSPLDAAKAIALMMYHKDEGADYLYRKNANSDALPVVAVPTTCGTGSEVTAISVLTIHEKETKAGLPHKIFPVYAFLDPHYLASAPASVIRNTAMDALAHMYESYLHASANVYNRSAVEAGLPLWANCKQALLSGNFTETDYGNLLRASTFAGIAIAQTGTAIPHGLSYGLTYHNGVAHGKACGFFLGRYLQAARIERSGGDKEVNHLLSLSGFQTVEDFEEFFQNTCGPVDVTKEDLIATADAVWSNPAKLAAAPFPVSKDLLYAIAGL